MSASSRTSGKEPQELRILPSLSAWLFGGTDYVRIERKNCLILRSPHTAESGMIFVDKASTETLVAIPLDEARKILKR